MKYLNNNWFSNKKIKATKLNFKIGLKKEIFYRKISLCTVNEKNEWFI